MVCITFLLDNTAIERDEKTKKVGESKILEGLKCQTKESLLNLRSSDSVKKGDVSLFVYETLSYY